MCGSFTCSKNTLVGLNVLYIIVSFIMIGVAVHGKVSGIVTSLPIVGGITACGIFLLLISVIGLIGTIRHHQVLLFFYMVVLFLIFLIQFSVSCAALAITVADEKALIRTSWKVASNKAPSVIVEAEQRFMCCGVGLHENLTTYPMPLKDDIDWSHEHQVFKPEDLCWHGPAGNETAANCPSCFSLISDKVGAGFNTAGGFGLFFSFTELLGGLMAYRYRDLCDPFVTPPSGAPFAGGM